MVSKADKYRKMLDRIKFLLDQSGNANEVNCGNCRSLIVERGRDVIEVMTRFEAEKQRR